MALRTVFGLEGNPLEFVQYESSTAYPCALCMDSTTEGISIAHKNGDEQTFCHSCFGFLQEGFDSIKERQLATHAKKNGEVPT